MQTDMRMLKPPNRVVRILAVAGGAGALLLYVPATSLAEPNASVIHVDGFVDYVTTDICSFPVATHAHQQGTIAIEQAANGTQFSVSFIEQDTFTANGVSLTSEQYGLHFSGLVDTQGNVVRSTTTGVLVKVPLPDGSTFFAAGRVDQLGSGSTFVTLPDVGTSRGQEEFCAALAA